MVNGLVIALLSAIFSVEYLIRERELLSRYLILVPEFLSALAMLIVLPRLMAGARVSLDWRYVCFLIVLALTMTFGYVFQSVPTGPIVAGIRDHLKFVPFFLLPAVYRFSSAQIRTQLVVLFAILVAQTPLAVYQRFFEYAHQMDTGDPVRGTASTSSALSLLMICAIATLVTLYYREKIRLRTLIAVGGVLFLPTMLNETKATLLLLPVALFAPALCMPRGSRAARRLVPVVALGAVAVVAFTAAYNALIQYRPTGRSLDQFVADRSFISYLYTGAADGEDRYIGRFDSIRLAVDGITKDPLLLTFGLGAGNVSTSFLPEFDGQFAAYYDRYGVNLTQVTSFLWQIGVIGLLTYLTFYYLLLRDAWRLATRASGSDALLGQAWAVVMMVMTFGLVYKAVFSMNEVGYLFWYFSGLVASRAVEHRRQAMQRPAAYARPWLHQREISAQ